MAGSNWCCCGTSTKYKVSKNKPEKKPKKLDKESLNM